MKPCNDKTIKRSSIQYIHTQSNTFKPAETISVHSSLKISKKEEAKKQGSKQENYKTKGEQSSTSSSFTGESSFLRTGFHRLIDGPRDDDWGPSLPASPAQLAVLARAVGQLSLVHSATMIVARHLFHKYVIMRQYSRYSIQPIRTYVWPCRFNEPRTNTCARASLLCTVQGIVTTICTYVLCTEVRSATGQRYVSNTSPQPGPASPDQTHPVSRIHSDRNASDLVDDRIEGVGIM